MDLKEQQHYSSARLLSAAWHRVTCRRMLDAVRDWRALARFHHAHLSVSGSEADVLPWHIAELMCCDIPEALMCELVSIAIRFCSGSAALSW